MTSEKWPHLGIKSKETFGSLFCVQMMCLIPSCHMTLLKTKSFVLVNVIPKSRKWATSVRVSGSPIGFHPSSRFIFWLSFIYSHLSLHCLSRRRGGYSALNLAVTQCRFLMAVQQRPRGRMWTRAGSHFPIRSSRKKRRLPLMQWSCCCLVLWTGGKRSNDGHHIFRSFPSQTDPLPLPPHTWQLPNRLWAAGELPMGLLLLQRSAFESL